MTNPHHHKSKRKRSNKFIRDKKVALLDRTLEVAGSITNVVNLHQTYKIWKQEDASDVSLLVWVAFVFYSTLFLIYGSVHKEKPIIIIYIFALLSQLSVVLSILYFR